MSPTMFSTSLARRTQAHSPVFALAWRATFAWVFSVLSQSHRGAHDQMEIQRGWVSYSVSSITLPH